MHTYRLIEVWTLTQAAVKHIQFCNKRAEVRRTRKSKRPKLINNEEDMIREQKQKVIIYL